MATNDLARRIRVDITLTTTTGADGVWTQLKGMTTVGFSIVPTKQDASNYDSLGWKDFDVTLNEWNGSVVTNRQSNAGVQDPGQLMLTNCVGKFAPNNYLYVRWYDNSGKAEPSFYGQAIVDQNSGQGGVAMLDADTFTFTGKGAAIAIANPWTAPAVPSIVSATPTAVAVGGIVNITGQYFTGTVGAAGVKFNAINATSYIVVSDNTIVAVMPAGSAGSAPIIVTNPQGASAAFPYTRGA